MASSLPARLSRRSIHTRLAALTPADYRRLALLARARAFGFDIDPEDLLHGAVLRAYDTRSCGVDVPVIAFLAGIMRSMVSQTVKAADARARVEGFWSETREATNRTSEDVGGTMPAVASPMMDAEASLARAVAGDDQLARLVDALADGLFGGRLAARLGVDAKGLATLKRRLARRLHAQPRDRNG